MEAILGLIEFDIRRQPRPLALARAVGLSVSRMYELFRKATGTGPARYVRTRRFEVAKRLLLTTYLTVKEIAEKVGIHDDSHFVRDFERIYGMSPRRFRRAHEEAHVQPRGGDNVTPRPSMTLGYRIPVIARCGRVGRRHALPRPPITQRQFPLTARKQSLTIPNHPDPRQTSCYSYIGQREIRTFQKLPALAATRSARTTQVL
jgi:AraC-like DNA-binding protein